MIEQICAGILAGGASSRMKTNKALLDVDGRTMLQHAYDICAIFPERLVSVDRAGRYAGLDLPMVEDHDKGIGPLEGLIRLMEEAKSPWLLLLAVDLPMVTEEFLRALADHLDPDSDGLLLLDENGRLEPLCAIYSVRLLEAARALKESGERRIRMLAEEARMGRITAQELGFSGGLLANINTPEEYRRMKDASADA